MDDANDAAIAVIQVTHTSWRDLRSVLQGVLKAGQVGVVFDCVLLTRVTSQTISDIAGYQAWFARQGGALALANLNQETKDLFRMLTLDQLFPLDMDTQAAMEWLRGQL